MRRRLFWGGCAHIYSGPAIHLIEAVKQVRQRIGQPARRVELIRATQIRVNLLHLGHRGTHVSFCLAGGFHAAVELTKWLTCHSVPLLEVVFAMCDIPAIALHGT